jgi:hypothetical protein
MGVESGSVLAGLGEDSVSPGFSCGEERKCLKQIKLAAEQLCESTDSRYKVHFKILFLFCFVFCLVRLGFELRALSLQSRRSTSGTTPSAKILNLNKMFKVTWNSDRRDGCKARPGPL